MSSAYHTRPESAALTHTGDCAAGSPQALSQHAQIRATGATMSGEMIMLLAGIAVINVGPLIALVVHARNARRRETQADG